MLIKIDGCFSAFRAYQNLRPYFVSSLFGKTMLVCMMFSSSAYLRAPAADLHCCLSDSRSYCSSHRPMQDIPSDSDPNIVCSICMANVPGSPRCDTLRAPCCKKYWYHRECIQVPLLLPWFFFITIKLLIYCNFSFTLKSNDVNALF